MFCTAMPKLPENEGVHPGGAEPEGEMKAVTACGIATGDALIIAEKARRRNVFCIAAA